MKNALKLAGTINIAIAIIAYLSSRMIIYPLILIILAFIYLKYTEKSISYLYEKKTQIILLSLTNLFVNPLSGIVMLIGQDKLPSEYQNSDKKEIKKEKLNQEEKKISILLNLGVGLVSLSGIILVTTNWNIMTNVTKIIILLFFALLFMLLSQLTEKKLKIEILSKNYWLLSMLFIILTIIGNGYFGIISNWFSFYGTGKYLYLSFTSIIISLLSLITNKKYEHPIYNNICYTGIISSIGLMFLHLNLSIGMALTVITIAFIFINTIRDEKLKSIKELFKYLTYVLSIICLIIMPEIENIIIEMILAIATIINIASITLNGTSVEGIISTIIINIVLLITLSSINLPFQITSLIAIVIYSVIYLINIIKIENKTFKTTLNIITNIMMLIITIANIDDKLLLTLITTIITLTSIINYSKNTIKYENILLPIKIAILIISLIALLEEIININISYTLIIIYIIVFTIYKLIKNKNIKTVSIVVYYIVFSLALLVNDNANIIPSIINIIAATTTFMLIKTENSNIKTKISYTTLLLTIASSIAYTNPLCTTSLNNGILVFLIYIMMTIIMNKNDKLNKIGYLSIILPLLIMNADYTSNYYITQIVDNIIEIYIIVLINMFLIKNDKDRNIVSTILTTLILSKTIFVGSWLIGLYIGTISLVLITIGFIKKDYKGLFIEGIIFTIVNIIIQFNYVLKELPLWLYTLIAGLIIIGLVTYKIIKDNENKQ